MKKQTKGILTLVLLFVFVAAMLSACALGDFGENTTETKLYKTYKTIVEEKGYKAVSEEEFNKLLNTVTAEGKTIESVVPQLKTSGEKEEWELTFVMSDGTTKTAVLPANKDNVDPNPNPNPNPDPDPKPSANDGKTANTAFTVEEATNLIKGFTDGAFSDGMYYVKGYVTSSPKKYTHSGTDTYNFNLADSKSDTSGQFQVYSTLLGKYSSVSNGDYVTIYGYLQKFVKDGNTTYEVAYNKNTKENPTIVNIEGKVTPTPDTDKGTTAEKAYTVPELLQAYASLGQNEFSSTAVYVKGKIIWGVDSYEDDDGPYSYMYIAAFDADATDENLEDYLYIEYFDMTDYPSLAIDDEVVMKGYIIHYYDEELSADELIMSFYTVDETAGTYIDPEIISVKSNGGTEDPDPTPDPTGHNFPSYFTYGKCTDEGCEVIGRKPADTTFKNNFKYTLTENQVATYLNAYNWMEENMTNTNVNVSTFYKNFETFANGLDNVICQNQVAEVLAYVSGEYTDFNNCNEYYNDMYDKYFAIIGKIYTGSNSKLKSELSQYVAHDDIDYAVSMAEVDGVADINNEIDRILAEYNNPEGTETVESLYERLVTQNNLLAEKYGYGKNGFMAYAYENVYTRDYTPAQTKAMSDFVVQYIKPLYQTVSEKVSALSESLPQSEYGFIQGFVYDDLFAAQSDSSFNDVKSALDSIAAYFKYLDNGTKVNFNNAVEDLFKTGNYFLGETEMAFTYYLYQYEQPILYLCRNDVGFLSPDYYYSSGFTFVHEFGHYYENIHNGNRNISMDFCETQSQGNEMLLTAWLANNNSSANAYEALKYLKLENMLETVLNATAVDEFEQAAYAGTYEGFATVNKNNYQDVYDAICEKFGISQGAGSNTYWKSVCFENAGYYISYAMSALPSVEIYAKAVDANGGIDVAKNAYLTLFTNSSDDYNTVLEAAGLHNAFQEDLYKYLQQTIK